MYLSYWGLQRPPFENVGRPEFFFRYQQHEEALARMLYAVTQRKGAFLLTGDVGCGKSTVIRAMIARMAEMRIDLANVTYPKLSASDLLQEICHQFSSDCHDKLSALRGLRKVAQENHHRERHTVVVLDEAQVINDPEVYEELRLLLNEQDESGFLMTLLFVGQPELRGMIDAIPQFSQRIGIRYHLHPMDFMETARYIVHRLKIAGGSRPLFTRSAVELIHRAANGIPRIINNICDLALLLGMSLQAKVIDQDTVLRVLEEEGIVPHGQANPAPS